MLRIIPAMISGSKRSPFQSGCVSIHGDPDVPRSIIFRSFPNDLGVRGLKPVRARRADGPVAVRDRANAVRT